MNPSCEKSSVAKKCVANPSDSSGAPSARFSTTSCGQRRAEARFT